MEKMNLCSGGFCDVAAAGTDGLTIFLSDGSGHGCGQPDFDFGAESFRLVGFSVHDATPVRRPGGHFADLEGRLAAKIAWLAACEAADGRAQK